MFRNLVVDLPKKGNVLIDDVTGMAKGGRVLALMGPSGEKDEDRSPPKPTQHCRGSYLVGRGGR